MMMAENHWTPEQIKALRQHLGMTQAEFAEAVGLRPGSVSVSRWETGRRGPDHRSRRALDELEKRTARTC